MEEFLIRFGLLAAFLGAALEGDGTALLAGVVAHLGFFSLTAAIATVAAGGMLVDCVCYGIGRVQAEAIRSTRVYRRVGPFVEQLVARVGDWEIVAARFVFGTRVASMMLWGMKRLPFVRFALFDLAGCTLWASGFVALGFGFSGSAAVLIGQVKRVEHRVVVALIGISLLVVVVRRALRPRVSARADHE
ncbi:MAG TPA: hypothetical protein VMW17_17065 [Candidatus Binatia bacterium]|nr:hypothetical protein [Candidatus Binatia bacterium]